MSEAGPTDNKDLKAWLRDLFHRRGPAAASLKIQYDEAPYELASRRWKSTPDDLRSEFLRIVRELIEEAASAPWSPEAFHQLAFFVEACGLLDTDQAFETAADILRRSQSEHRDQLHMIALRTLLSLGWTGTPEFWLAQEQSIGTKWPELIFVGLARHDLDAALARLPHLIKDAEQMQRLLQHFPSLLRQLRIGISDLRAKCRRCYTPMPEDAAQLMREWFQLHASSPKELPVGTSETLWVGLGKVLGQDPKPTAVGAGASLSAREVELVLTSKQ